jgi:hypothetical protein
MSIEGRSKSTLEAARTADAEIATPAPTRVNPAPLSNRLLPGSLNGRARCSTPLARAPTMWGSGSGTLFHLHVNEILPVSSPYPLSLFPSSIPGVPDENLAEVPGFI